MLRTQGFPRGGGRARSASSFLLITDTMDFSGLSLIKLKKQEMETQVSTLMPPAARLPLETDLWESPGTHGQR